MDLEGTVMQPRTSSSDIEWGTPNHPLTQISVADSERDSSSACGSSSQGSGNGTGSGIGINNWKY